MGSCIIRGYAFEIDGAITLTKKGVYSIKKKDEYRVSYFNPSDEEYHSDTIETILSQEIVQEATNKDKSTIIRLSIDKDTRKSIKRQTKEKENKQKKDKQKKENQLEKKKELREIKSLMDIICSKDRNNELLYYEEIDE